VISGILHVLKTRCRWRDTPAAYGPPTIIDNRYNRWASRGIWQRLFEKIAGAEPVPEELSIDSTHVKAHRSAPGSKRGSGTKRSAVGAEAGRARSLPGR
jgi:transposase